MHGLYHVSATPIAKLDLLKLVASTYGKLIDIQPNDDLVIDRSLNSSRFAAETGYSPPSWPELVEAMHRFG
jgi:dTDP-4-dehydrorhamnose reductase